MLVTVDMLVANLRRRCASTLGYVGAPDCVIERIRPFDRYPSEDPEPGTLYVRREEDMPTCTTIETMDDCAILSFRGHAPSADRCIETRDAKDAGGVEDVEDVEGMIGLAWETLIGFQEWSNRLQVATIQDVPLSNLMALGERMIPHPFALIDNDLEIRAMSAGFTSANTGFGRIAPIGDSPVEVFGLKPELMARQFTDGDFPGKMGLSKPYYHRFSEDARPLYCTNFHSSDRCIARFAVVVPPGLDRLESGDERIADYFSSFLKQIHSRRTGDAEVTLEKNDTLHVLFRKLCLDADPETDIADIRRVLSGYGWHIDDDYILICFRFSNEMRVESLNTFVVRYLQEQWPATIATCHGQTVLWLFNFTASGDGLPETAYRPALDQVIREYLCKAGISDRFADFPKVRDYYREAVNALSFGETVDPHLWCYTFHSYIYEYIKHRLTAEFDARQLCHRGLLRLLDYDAAHHTPFVDTLSCFLRCSQNVTRAASELYIHRTSFMRRMKRISDIADIDFEDSETIQYLMISLIMLGRLD